MGLREWIVPQERLFFDLLEQDAAAVEEGAYALLDLMKDFRDVASKRRHIKDIEHRGDEVVHSIYEELNKTFITPIDREDIMALASDLDNVLDMIDAAANRLHLYEIERPTPGMVELAQVIVHAVTALRRAVGMIRNMKQAGEVERIAGKVGGIAVSVGARIAALAAPSEVLVSQTVRDLVSGSGLSFEDAGEHELKGVPDRWRLYRVVSESP